MRRYVVEYGTMVASVRINSSRNGVMFHPSTMNTRLKRNVPTRDVCTALRRLGTSWAPKYWEMITLAPVLSPMKNPTRVLMAGVTVVTPPRAAPPTKLPTTTLSTALYICWNKFPNSSGRANHSKCRQMEPWVISLVVVLAKWIPSLLIKTLPEQNTCPGGPVFSYCWLIYRSRLSSSK